MKTTVLTIPELMRAAGTRALLGAGLAFLAADHLDAGQRRAIGFVLTAIGVITTVPLMLQVRGHLREPS
jgi:hypothetical protein